MGRRPKSESELRLLGTYRADRHAGRDASAEPGEPPVKPADLSTEAGAVWDQVVPALAKSGLLLPVDGKPLARYCVLSVDFAKAQEQGDMPVVLKLAGTLLALENVLGMTPAARSKLPKVAAKPQADKMAKYFTRTS